MKHIKMISAIIIAAILCAGCAETKDESSVPEVTTTAATTTEATTTAATTTTVTEATTTVSTDESTKPDVAPETDEPVEDSADTSAPAESTTTDGKYTLADTDLVNPDGTYTQNEFKEENIPIWCDPELSDPQYKDFLFEYLQTSGSTSCPSKIPYSEITIENAAEAFPFLGWIGYKPDYTMVLPTDSPEVITDKVRDNLMGNEPTIGYDLWKYYNFTSEADYNAYLAEQEQQAEENRLLGEQAAAENADPNHKIGDGLTDEDLDNIWDLLQSRSE